LESSRSVYSMLGAEKPRGSVLKVYSAVAFKIDL
jgi:hypothetical protein